MSTVSFLLTIYKLNNIFASLLVLNLENDFFFHLLANSARRTLTLRDLSLKYEAYSYILMIHMMHIRKTIYSKDNTFSFPAHHIVLFGHVPLHHMHARNVPLPIAGLTHKV